MCATVSWVSMVLKIRIKCIVLTPQDLVGFVDNDLSGTQRLVADMSE